MTTEQILIAVLSMAGVTYLLRMLPVAIFRKKIKNNFLRSFLAYIPYAVLSAMTFPAILYSTSSLLSAAVGSAVALVLAYFGKGLLTVALASSAAVFLVEQAARLFGG